jgi:uncharacterized protein YgbK (DUF1537 family)
VTVLLGCIADDLTGATDLANMLAREGMRTVQTIGIPARELVLPPADAVVIALKSRTIPVEDAVRQSLVALDWLKRNGARQILFKYCSTFDSTDAGNIGPVADALLKALHARFTIVCPAFPENGRSLFQGNLFVGNVALADSGMRHHPLTPMTDSNLVRVLGRQTKAKVGLVPYNIVREGPAAIRKAFEQLQHDGMTFAIVDAIENQHLRDIGAAASDLALITGGSGIAIGLPANFRKENRLAPAGPPEKLERIEGLSAVLSGSCSQATLGQIAAWKARRPAFALDPLALAQGRDLVADATAWAQIHMSREPVLIYASAPPEEVAKVQAALGREKAGALIEETLARIAQRLVAAGLRKLVIAGGETSGAIVQRLGVSVLKIGPQIDPGVPWTVSLGTPRLALALKSGNFGGPDFFIKALEMLA